MSDIKNLPADLQGLPSFPCNGSRYYYKEKEDGTKELVAQLFGKSHFIIRYPKGSTIDTLPEDSVGSREIEDGGVQMEDLAPEVRAKLNPADNEQYSENSDVDEMFPEQASTQPTVPTQPLVVEEEEEP